MGYLHQKDFYYGDMKPQNLLVFRDQRVKVGDLGISIKMESDGGDSGELYELKGLSKAYASQSMF